MDIYSKLLKGVGTISIIRYLDRYTDLSFLAWEINGTVRHCRTLRCRGIYV